MNAFIEHIHQKVKLDSSTTEAVLAVCEKRKFSKGENLIDLGRQCKHFFLIQQGIVRSYYLHDGVEVSSWFYKEQDVFTSWHSFYGDLASMDVFEALEDGEVLVISKTNFNRLANEHPLFERYARLLAEEQTNYLDQYTKGWNLASAQEKYESLLAVFPDIELRVKLGFIASFLGISQETLSRLRAKINR